MSELLVSSHTLEILEPGGFGTTKLTGTSEAGRLTS